MTIEDTTKTAAQDPMRTLAELMTGGVEGQEKRGQPQLTASAQIPIEVRNATDDDLRALGFMLGNRVDSLFREATLPDGWEKRRTNHPMYTDVVDEQGRRRASIFYKAAFYDRRAHMRFHRRYTCRKMSEGGYGSPETPSVIDTATGEVLFSAGTVERPGADASREERSAHYKRVGEQCKIAREWLTEHYPDHDDPHAYW